MSGRASPSTPASAQAGGSPVCHCLRSLVLLLRRVPWAPQTRIAADPANTTGTPFLGRVRQSPKSHAVTATSSPISPRASPVQVHSTAPSFGHRCGVQFNLETQVDLLALDANSCRRDWRCRQIPRVHGKPGHLYWSSGPRSRRPLTATSRAYRSETWHRPRPPQRPATNQSPLNSPSEVSDEWHVASGRNDRCT